MKTKIKYLLLLIPILIFFIFNKKSIEKPKEIYSNSEKNNSKVEKTEDKKDKDFKRKIIYLSPPSKKITTFTNKKNDQWMNLLENNLLKFQEPSTSVKIVHLEGIIFSEYDKARLAEKVLVSYSDQNGLISSFNAYVDSQTGQIIGLPWNKTVVENKNWPKLQPSGVIKQVKQKKVGE